MATKGFRVLQSVTAGGKKNRPFTRAVIANDAGDRYYIAQEFDPLAACRFFNPGGDGWTERGGYRWSGAKVVRLQPSDTLSSLAAWDQARMYTVEDLMVAGHDPKRPLVEFPDSDLEAIVANLGL